MATFFISEARRSRPAVPTTAPFTGTLPLSRKMLPAFESVVLVVGAEVSSADGGGDGACDDGQKRMYFILFVVFAIMFALALLLLAGAAYAVPRPGQGPKGVLMQNKNVGI